MNTTINTFFGEQKVKEVFLLLGTAGSGKSIILQLRFINAITSWKSGDPLPIYFNLANGTDLSDVLLKMNQELKTDLSLQRSLKGQSVHLYIDSFDEGVGTRLELRNTLLQSYIEQLSSIDTYKILISCRSDYLQTNKDDEWFTPKSVDDGQLQPHKMQKCFVTPINYRNKQNLSKSIDQYLNNKQAQKNTDSGVVYTAKNYLAKLEHARLQDAIDTGFMFYMVMQTLPSINQNDISRYTIYRHFVTSYYQREIAKLTQEQREKMERTFKGFSDADFCGDLAKYIASELHFNATVRITQESALFEMLQYKRERAFNYQLASHVLQLLPLKIEVNRAKEVNNNDKKMEQITIGFKHDILKNYCLVESVQDELRTDAASKILGVRSIVTDRQLLKLMAECVNRDENSLWRSYLVKAINDTKTNKSVPSVTIASNAITLLVMVKHPFSGEDLSNISIRRANLRNGMFNHTDFGGADLSEVDLTSAKLSGANLESAIMENVKLGILPELRGHTDAVRSVVFSPDGKNIATASSDGTVKIWDAAAGVCILDLKVHTFWAHDVAFSRDGKRIVTAAHYSTVKIWDAVTGSHLLDLVGHRSAVISVAFSPDGKTIATGAEDAATIVWDAATGDRLLTLPGNTYMFRKVVFSPDGKTIATVSDDTVAKIWNASTGECLLELKGHSFRLASIMYSPDGKTIATGSWDDKVIIWDATTGIKLLSLKHKDKVFALTYSPDGKTIATASMIDNALKLWDTTTGNFLLDLKGHARTIRSVAYSPDGKIIATASEDKVVKIWDAAIDIPLPDLAGHDSSLNDIACSPDGKTIASVAADAKVWDAVTGNHLFDLKGHGWHVNSVAYSPDGKTIVTTGNDSYVKIWDSATGVCLKSIRESDLAYSAIYSPDGMTIASGSQDPTIKIWNAVTCARISVLKGHKASINSVVYSPDGKTIATASDDKTVKIWDAVTYTCLLDFIAHTKKVTRVVYSPDGKTIATASEDSTAKIWDSATGTQLFELKGHKYTVMGIAYSPDGTTVITTAGDRLMKIWDVTTGTHLSDITGNTSDVRAVAYSPDGKAIFTGSHDSTIKKFIHKKDKWMLAIDISMSEGAFSAPQAILKNTINLSKVNTRVFEQNDCLVDEIKHQHIVSNIRQDEKDLDQFTFNTAEQFFNRFVGKYLTMSVKYKKEVVATTNTQTEDHKAVDEKTQEVKDTKSVDQSMDSFTGKKIWPSDSKQTKSSRSSCCEIY